LNLDEKHLNNLRTGIPLEDIERIHVNTKSFIEVVHFLEKEIDVARKINKLRKIFLVGPRGMGKTHILSMLEDSYINHTDYILFSVKKTFEPVDLIKTLVRNWGKTKLIEELQQIKKRNGFSASLELFKYLEDEITNFSPFNIAISLIDDPEFGFLAWKWMTDRLGQGEVNSLRYGRIKITRNITNEEALRYFKSFCLFLKLSSGKTPIILIDEFQRLSSLTKRKKNYVKDFLVDLINENWDIGIFICIFCTDLAWEEVEGDPYSRSIGLTRRSRKIDLFGLSNVTEAEELFNNLLTFYPKDLFNKIEDFVSDRNLLRLLYDQTLRNPGNIIKGLIENIDEFLMQTNGVISPKTTNDLINTLLDEEE